jgi:hypothetical protein
MISQVWTSTGGSYHHVVNFDDVSQMLSMMKSDNESVEISTVKNVKNSKLLAIIINQKNRLQAIIWMT